jgi:hypothetical protein
MAVKCSSLCEEIRRDTRAVIRQCRELAKSSRSAGVRARLAHLAEYAELLEAEAGLNGKSIRFAGKVD